MLQKVLCGKFFSCPQCGKALAGEMESYFTCPNCKKALCMERQFKSFNDNYCGNCGHEITSAKEKALALIGKDNLVF